MIPSHFFTVRLGIDWFIKVVIERLEVVVSVVWVEIDLRLLLTQLAGHQPQLLRLRGVEEAVEGSVVIHLPPLPPPPPVLHREIEEVHLPLRVLTLIITEEPRGPDRTAQCTLHRYRRYDWGERWLSTDRPEN